MLSAVTRSLQLAPTQCSTLGGATRQHRHQKQGLRQPRQSFALRSDKDGRQALRACTPRAQQQQRAGYATGSRRNRNGSTSVSPVCAGAVSGGGDGYLTVLVYVTVKEGREGDFAVASVDNARNSVQEPGVVRFDVLHSVEEPNKFVLVEIYKNEDAPAQHKETEHYLRWRDTVADMMEEPRSATKYYGCFPDTAHWPVPEALSSGRFK